MARKGVFPVLAVAAVLACANAGMMIIISVLSHFRGRGHLSATATEIGSISCRR